MKITIESPLDMHLHVREQEMLRAVMPLSARTFAGGVIMPNLVSPITSVKKLDTYEQEVLAACGEHRFTPFMTLFFKPYSRQELVEAKARIIGIKLYPAGITTQSENGVRDFDTVQETVGVMEELGIPLLVHGESSGFVMDREKQFLETYRELAVNFPRLHMIMEHITTADSIEFLEKYQNVSATVTLHHLMITLDDVIGGLMNPHLFCKPVAKTPRDRDALRTAVLGGHQRIMFGSDSAPHPVHKKECCGCAAGVFTAPIALQLLAQIFEQEGALDLLQGFVSDIAKSRYRVSVPKKSVTLEKKPFQVPEIYGTIKPFYGGTTINWTITDISE